VSASPAHPTNEAGDRNRFSRRRTGQWLLALAATPFLAGCVFNEDEEDDGYGIIDWDGAAREAGPARSGAIAPPTFG